MNWKKSSVSFEIDFYFSLKLLPKWIFQKTSTDQQGAWLSQIVYEGDFRTDLLTKNIFFESVTHVITRNFAVFRPNDFWTKCWNSCLSAVWGDMCFCRNIIVGLNVNKCLKKACYKKNWIPFSGEKVLYSNSIVTFSSFYCFQQKK